MSIHIQLTPRDYLAANLRVLRWPNLIMMLFGLGFVVFGASKILALFGGSADKLDGLFQTVIGLMILLLFVLNRFVVIPRRVRRIFRQQKNLQRPLEFGWDRETVWSSSEIGNTKRPWSDFTKWRELKGLFLLYHSDVMFQMIPKRSFPNPDAVDEFRQLLLEKLGRSR